MSKINMVAFLKSQKSAQTNVPAPSPAKADWRSPDAPWRSLPMKGTQFLPLATLLRTKDLLAITDPTIATIVSNFEFDNDTGHWNFEGISRGVASDLIGALKALPNVGFSAVSSGTAEPVTTTPNTTPQPASKPKKATKSAAIKAPALGVHETSDGLRFEVYKDSRGAVRTRMI